MYNIKTMNKIAKIGLDNFTADFAVSDSVENPDGILVRSASLHEMPINENLLAVARAGAGTNNIPSDIMGDKGVVVFNTPGANANAVKELVICGILLASRDVVGGINWVKENAADPDIAKAVEKNKSQFAGNEIKGKTLGVIGLGAIGGPLANAARHLGMKVYGFDPYLSVEAAWNLSRDIIHAKSKEEIYEKCDFISVHVPLIASDDPSKNTKGMIGEKEIAMMKDGVVILNFARDALIDDAAMSAALDSGKVKRYVTDFPNPASANMKNVIAIPHLGASTEESEDNCAVMAVQELSDYILNGNIKNSVNYPNAELPRSGKARVCVNHKNIPNVLSQISGVMGEAGANIENMINKSKKENAYTIMEATDEIPEGAYEKLMAIEGVIRVRIIH
ncbi:MAG: phosphoglycerate dehydrogenase [Clostridia bacterium]|nr:phosphoglycerate dehydrogenase [Clostridia bacterium]